MEVSACLARARSFHPKRLLKPRPPRNLHIFVPKTTEHLTEPVRPPRGEPPPSSVAREGFFTEMKNIFSKMNSESGISLV